MRNSERLTEQQRRSLVRDYNRLVQARGGTKLAKNEMVMLCSWYGLSQEGIRKIVQKGSR